MEWQWALLFILGILVFFMLLGLPVAFAFMAANVIGLVVFLGGGAFRSFIMGMATSIGTFVLLPVPLFILMGLILFNSGMGMRAVDVLDKWLGRLPGRLGLIAVGASTLFSTMTGATMSTVAMLGSLMVPEMEKRGYKRTIAIGSVMGSGGLAILIPPSSYAVLLAAVAGVSVGQLLIAGIIPGLVIAFFYASYVILRCWLQPSIAPSYAVLPIPLSVKIVDTLRYVLPLGIIIFLVTGVIFVGVATPSEAAATGALGTVLLAVIYRGMNWDVVKKTAVEVIRICGMILMIVAGAVAFSQILAFSGATQGMIKWITSLPLNSLMLLIAMQVILLILGMFMSGYPMIMITIPIFMPVVHALGLNPVWFCLLMLINIEIGQTTPPFGLVLFVMKGVAPRGTTMGEIIRAGLPFIGCDFLAMALVIAFPALALLLPSMMIS